MNYGILGVVPYHLARHLVLEGVKGGVGNLQVTGLDLSVSVGEVGDGRVELAAVGEVKTQAGGSDLEGVGVYVAEIELGGLKIYIFFF